VLSAANNADAPPMIGALEPPFIVELVGVIVIVPEPVLEMIT
jgi:hypothetical protein